MTSKNAPRGIAILGSTGSIGTTALRVLERQGGRFRVAALTAFNNAALLEEQVDRFRPSFVGIVHNGS
jgi:1-deoxy-D-xylulose-5-phosphate reductoisomerase